jgi:hypothetical protein
MKYHINHNQKKINIYIIHIYIYLFTYTHTYIYINLFATIQVYKTPYAKFHHFLLAKLLQPPPQARLYGPGGRWSRGAADDAADAAPAAASDRRRRADLGAAGRQQPDGLEVAGDLEELVIGI